MHALAVELRGVLLPRPAPRWAAGLVVVALIVAAAFAGHHVVPAVSPLLWAMAFGVLAAPLARARPATSPGVKLAATHLLRAGVALVGLRISLTELGGVGVAGLAAAGASVVCTMALTTWLGRRLGLDRKLALLIAAGSAICGASAIAAMNGVTRAREEQVGYAVATVTVFGTAAMLALPPLSGALGLSDAQAGMWAGASVHEVAQATAAGAAVSAAALKLATLVKLSRVVMLGVVVAAVSARSERSAGATPRVPAFVLAFLALVILRSAAAVPQPLLDAASLASAVLLAAGLAALGLGIRVAQLRGAGLRPFALGLVASCVAAASAFGALVALS